MFFLDFPDYQETRLIRSSCRNLNKIRIIPKRLGFDKIDAMLFQIALTFSFIVFKRMHGIENIPLLLNRQVAFLLLTAKHLSR